MNSQPLPEQPKAFEAFSNLEIAVGTIAVPGTLYAGSKIYEDLSHYEASLINISPPTAANWHPSPTETVAAGAGLPLLASAGLVALTSVARRVIYNRRHSS
jgi:hypothetical protein